MLAHDLTCDQLCQLLSSLTGQRKKGEHFLAEVSDWLVRYLSPFFLPEGIFSFFPVFFFLVFPLGVTVVLRTSGSNRSLLSWSQWAASIRLRWDSQQSKMLPFFAVLVIFNTKRVEFHTLCADPTLQVLTKLTLTLTANWSNAPPLKAIL